MISENMAGASLANSVGLVERALNQINEYDFMVRYHRFYELE